MLRFITKITIPFAALVCLASSHPAAAIGDWEDPTPIETQRPLPLPSYPMTPPADLTTPSPAPGAPQVTVDVSHCKAFTKEANYMSLPGCFRYLSFVQLGEWISHDDAITAAASQMESATR